MAENALDAEISAMQSIASALDSLDEAARARVVTWAASRFEVALSTPKPKGKQVPDEDEDADEHEDHDHDGAYESPEWEHFADLFDAAGPTAESDRMLVAAYWAQEVDGKSQFGSFELNKMLKDLGHGATHTAMSMDNLIARRPALILQLKKSGKSQQGRRTYKMTRAGADAVRAMTRGS